MTAYARVTYPPMRPHYHDSMRAMVATLRGGSTLRSAAGSVGISEATWHRWQRACDAGTMEDPRVVALVADARAAFEAASADLMARITEASRLDWKAAAWALDHRRTDRRVRHDDRRARWEAEIAAKRAKGEHVERMAVDDGAVAELREKLKRALGE